MALAKVPAQTFDDPFSAVGFEVFEGEETRFIENIIGVTAGEKSLKESLFGLISPVTAAHRTDEQRAAETQRGAKGGARTAEIAQPAKDTATVTERAVEIKRGDNGVGSSTHRTSLTGLVVLDDLIVYNSTSYLRESKSGR